MGIVGTGDTSLAEAGHRRATRIAQELADQQTRHRRVQLLRRLAVWWYVVALVAAGGLVAALMGQFALDAPKEVFGALIAVPLLLVACRRVEFGLLIFAIWVTPFVPSALKVSSLYISPALPLLVLLFLLALQRSAFRVREIVFPSLWTIWPLVGLAVMAVISEVQAQATWLYGVPRSMLGNPIAFEEGIGVALYFLPLLVTTTVSACLSDRERWIRYIQYALLLMALLDALVILYEFKHIGADLYAFRYASPSIGWMPLEALAQLLVLGCILAYARVLYADAWKARLIFGAALLVCLLALYFSLENSWWLEAGVALTVMTLVYSRRLFALLVVASLPFLPLVRAFLQKLQSVKSVDALRLTIWQDMLRVWSKRPVMGVGPGNIWVYDQVFTHLPQGLRDFAKSGLGVAHEGYLQTLGELGPLGLFFQVAFIAVFIVAAARLFRCSRSLEKQEVREDRILGLVGLGLICGSAAGDLVASYFFLPPRQSLHVASLPQALVSWVIYGCVLYKDQLRRLAIRARARA
jgi:O-antigen ligase